VWNNWRYIEPTGSDHETIAFEAFDPTPSSKNRRLEQLQATYNCKKADWEAFSKLLVAKESLLIEAIEEAITSRDYELAADLLLEAIKSAAETTIPRKRVSERSKPWWNDELTILRKAQSTAFRAYKRQRTSESEESYKQARNAYFQAIRTAKQEYWTSYLEGLKD
jgi:hypothetical protein